MLEYCEFCELNEDVLRECGGFSCKERDITEEGKSAMQPMHTRLMYFDLILLCTR